MTPKTLAVPRPKLRPYIWDRGKPTATTGAILLAGGNRTFIPDQDLRRIADALHDRADHLEQGAGE